MPYKIIKLKNYYKVINKNTGQVKAKKTTKINAERMIRLLNYIDAKKYNKK